MGLLKYCLPEMHSAAGLSWCSCCACMQAKEPVLASFLHQNIISHSSLGKAMAVLLANKLSSRTLLGTQLMQLISEAYWDDPVRKPSTHCLGGHAGSYMLLCLVLAGSHMQSYLLHAYRFMPLCLELSSEPCTCGTLGAFPPDKRGPVCGPEMVTEARSCCCRLSWRLARRICMQLWTATRPARSSRSACSTSRASRPSSATD
jgi:hypothetical protein